MYIYHFSYGFTDLLQMTVLSSSRTHSWKQTSSPWGQKFSPKVFVKLPLPFFDCQTRKYNKLDMQIDRFINDEGHVALEKICSVIELGKPLPYVKKDREGVGGTDKEAYIIDDLIVIITQDY